MSKNIFLTGVTSRLGINFFTKLLLETDHKLFILIRRKPEQLDLDKRLADSLLIQNAHIDLSKYRNRYEIIKGDLDKNQIGIDDEVYERLKQFGVHEVWHLAAYSDRKMATKDRLFRTNINGTLKLLTFSKELGVHCFTYVGMLYAESLTEVEVKETDVISLCQFNSISEFTKKIAERTVRDFCQKSGMCYRILRPGLIIDFDNLVNIENAWYYHMFHTLFSIREGCKAVYGKHYFEQHALRVLAKDVTIYIAKIGYLSSMMVAMLDDEETYGKVFNLHSCIFSFNELATMLITRTLTFKRIEQVAGLQEMPYLQRHYYERSLATLAYLGQNRVVFADNAEVVEGKYNIKKTPIDGDEVARLAKACDVIFLKNVQVQIPHGFKKLFIRIFHAG